MKFLINVFLGEQWNFQRIRKVKETKTKQVYLQAMNSFNGSAHMEDTAITMNN